MSCNFADLFEHAVDAMPDRVALIEGDRVLTFRELDEQADRLADHLASVGVAPGTHIGFQMHNDIDTMTTLIACFKTRAVPININYRYGVEELRYIYDSVDLEVLFYHATYERAVRTAAASMPALRHLIVVDDRATDGGPAGPSTPGKQGTASCDTRCSVDHHQAGRSRDGRFRRAGATCASTSRAKSSEADLDRPRDIASAQREARLPLGEGVLGGSRAGSPGGPLMWSICANSLVTTTRTCSNSDVSAVVLGRIR
ncbi:AMP-binding protein [Nocardia sp. NBC_00403]|uniref:AMP-binding protein n=1 Tax=Nocardia sp. NBC_00403 TaxID=2975990 RepID=UPI002E20E62F